MIRSFSQVLQVYPECRLVIAGFLLDPSKVLSLTGNAASKIIFTGQIPKKELDEWISITDIGILPSYTEQCCYWGIELMMHGVPVITTDGFNLQEMLNQINARLDEDFPGVEIWAEPGRFICGTAVNLITSVIGVTERGGQPWYFLDEGLYGTFSGVLFDQWDFKLISFKEGEQVAATFAGPSCDSLDIMFRGKMTVRQEEGDLILVPICGAYTSASATTFNGFSKANFVVWEDVKETLMAPQLLKAQ